MTTFREFIADNFGIKDFNPVVKKVVRLPKGYDLVANFSLSSERSNREEEEFYMTRGIVSSIIEHRGIGMIKAENCQSYPYELKGTDVKVGDKVSFSIEAYHARNVQVVKD